MDIIAYIYFNRDFWIQLWEQNATKHPPKVEIFKDEGALCYQNYDVSGYIRRKT